MKYRSFGLLCLGAAFFACAEAPLTAPSVLQHIQAVGPKRALSGYFGTPQWNAILKGIGSADEQWLEVYKRLKPVSDAASSEDLDSAVWNQALPRKPFMVFPLIADHSCVFTFEADCPPQGITPYLDQLEETVKKARTAEERNIRDSCLKGIAKTRAAFPNPQAYCQQ